MKWILVLSCVLWSDTIVFATSSSHSLAQSDDHQRETNYRQSSQRFYEDGMLEGEVLHFAKSCLRKAIDLRKTKLGQRAEAPLLEIKQKELDELSQRRIILQQVGQDLYNEKLQTLEKLEAKRQMASRFKRDLQLLAELDTIDRKIEVLEGGDEETRGPLIQERHALEKKLSPKGANVFRLKTSLGILDRYLSTQDWSDMTSVLHNVTEYIQNRSRNAMNTVYVRVPAEAISSNKTVVLEGLLLTMPSFLTAINRFIHSFDREMVIAMSLSSRPDLAEAYEAEVGLEDRPTEKLLYALGILGQYRAFDNGFEGSTKELEEQMQSFEAAILIIKEQEAERIRQRMNQNPVVDISSSEDDGNERENDSAEVSSSESSDEGSEDAGPDLPIVPAVLNGDEDLDTDAYFGQFQTGAHLAAFIKIKNMETQKGVLSAFLESARLEEAKKYQDPNFWRLHLWIFALEKGLLNISQIQPVIKMLQDLVILGDDEGAVI